MPSSKMTLRYDLEDAIRLVRVTKNPYEVGLAKIGLREEPIVKFRNGLKFYYVKDLFSIEHFLEEPFKLVNAKGKDVVDVGACNADTSLYFAMKGAKRVFAFEPFPRSFEAALRNIRLNNAMNIELFNEALGGHEEVIVVDSSHSTRTSVLEPSENGKPVRIRTLDSIVSDYDIRDAVLKANCEGCEYDLILSSTEKTLARFTQVMIMCRNDPQPVRFKLEHLGYSVKLLDNWRRGAKLHVELLYASK